MDVTRKEEYEIDPNSSFNRLRTLQKNLKEETALRENYSKSKDELLKTIDSHCYEYFKAKIAIQELYDMSITSETNNIKYIVSENSQAELPQCYDPLYKLMFNLRNDNSLMLKLIEKSNPSHYDTLSTLICHLFYDNIFCSNQSSDDLLLIIYLLLEKEIDEFISSFGSKALSSDNFLNSQKSFIVKLLNNLLRKNEVRQYLELVLSEVIIDFENLNNLTNENNSNINLDFRKIKDEIIKDKKKDKKLKKVFDYKELLTSKITYSNIFKKLNNTIRDRNKIINHNTLYEKNQNVINYQIFSTPKEEEEFSYKSIENYYEENGLYDNKKKIDDNNTAYNSSYEIDLNKKEINEKLKVEKDVNMIEFFLRQIDLIQTHKDDQIFNVNNILADLQNDKDLKDNAEKIILTYKYSYERIKEYIDFILYSIIKNNSHIPYIIKCICLIIDKLLSIKLPESTVMIRNTFICNFFFDNLILYQLSHPSYNGLIPELIDSKSKRRKIELVTKVIKQMSKGQFFCASNEKDKLFTMFNNYFIETMPFIFKICSNLREVKLPKTIELLLETSSKQKDENISRNINYNYLQENPNEFIELQSICFSIIDFSLIYEIIKENEEFFCSDKTHIFSKTFKKLTFQEKTVYKKINIDHDKGKKIYLYLTKTNYSDKINSSVFAQKSQKFSFQSASEDMKENANELFIFERVKYSINTIVKHLNTLTRANFSADSESMENFVIGLNTMIELEGFSEMLKEKTIPLDWFGLYLQSNIGGIPQSKKRANYYQLYSDLIDDSKANYNVIKSDDTLNWVISKTKISEKNIEIQNNALIHYKAMIKRFQSAKFFSMENEFKICLKVNYKDGVPSKITINVNSNVCKEKQEKKKSIKHIHIDTINQLIQHFPDLIEGTTETELLKFHSNINAPNSIEKFFESLKNIIKHEHLIQYETKDEFKSIFAEIQNIIFRKLHYKLYPKMPSEKDVFLFKKCFNFSWIKPHHLNKDLFGINEDMLTLAANYIKMLNNETSPQDKINSFSKAFEIIQSTLTLYKIQDEHASVMLLVYAFIKSQLMGIETNYLYIVLYCTKEQKTSYHDLLISYLGKIITVLEHLSKDKLIDISDEEYSLNVQRMYETQ